MRGSRQIAGLAGLYLIFLGSSLFAPPFSAAQDPRLPAESVVPGSEVRDQAPRPKELPPESQLPGSQTAPRFELTDDRLPSEAELPQAVRLDEDLPDADPPWLRLRLDGPTGPVLALHFSPDSGSLLAGGADKQLHRWSLFRGEGDGARWMYDDAAPWQVQRGPRGEIHQIATTRDQVAFAGIGATALTGEIGVISPHQFRLQRTLYDLTSGPRSQIMALTASLDHWISLDSEGRLSRWKRDLETGLWQHKEVVPPDNNASLRPWRMRGIAIASDARGNVYYPKVGRYVGEVPYWRIVGRLADDDREFVLPANFPEFPGGIGALCIDPAGGRLLAADISDQATLVAWDRTRTGPPQQISVGANVRGISMTRDGRRFVASVAASPEGPFELRTWTWPSGQPPRLQRTIRLASQAAAAAISPDGNWLAYSQGSGLIVQPWDPQPDAVQRLASPIVSPVQVAFASQNNGYQLAVRGQTAGGEEQSFRFETQTRRLLQDDDQGEENIDENRPLVAANPWSGTWALRSQADASGTRTTYSVQTEGRPYGTLPLDAATDGRVVSACWYHPGPNQQRPTRLLVGTSGRNHAFLFDISEPGQARLLREYRGHWSAIRSVGVSPDARYLVTGSDDATIRIWKLPAEEETSASLLSWGAEFEQIDNQVVITSLTPDGPLVFRGARVGDVIRRVVLSDRDNLRPGDGGRQELAMETPATILDSLGTADGRTMLRFELSRQNIPQRPFYLHPAWQPLVSLAVTTDREWAYWTPYGYYDASFNGHKIFGWQFNRGPDQPPDFFLASELRQQMERPAVMENVLEAGSLEAAMKIAHTAPPANLHTGLETLAGLQPRITILSPSHRETLASGRATVEATIDVPAGVRLETPKLYANAVPAIESELIERAEVEGRDRYHYRWTVLLPPDPLVRLQVLAATAEGIAAAGHVSIENMAPQPARAPRIHLIAMGVNRYADLQIPRLDFAASNVETTLATLQRHTGGQLQVDALTLVNEGVTKGLWNLSVDTLLSRIADSVGPQDLILIFLSGHGVRDVESQSYYFLTSQARFHDVMGRRYQHCISSADLSKFAALPCRKVVILDTCHSGALGSLREEDLKTIVRTLQGDLMLTITASQGDEEAFESADQRLSRFTARLVKGLEGEADLPHFGGDQDGTVTLRELAAYLKSTVPDDARQFGHRQSPTVSPADLLPLVEIPLAYPRSEAVRTGL